MQRGDKTTQAEDMESCTQQVKVLGDVLIQESKHNLFNVFWKKTKTDHDYAHFHNDKALTGLFQIISEITVTDPQRLFARLISIFSVIRNVFTVSAPNFVICNDKGVMSQKAELKSRGTQEAPK